MGKNFVTIVSGSKTYVVNVDQVNYVFSCLESNSTKFTIYFGENRSLGSFTEKEILPLTKAIERRMIRLRGVGK